MRDLIAVLRLAWPFRSLAALVVLFSALMVLFSIVSIPVLIPFLQMLLGQTPIPTGPPPAWAWNGATIQAWVNHKMAQQIATHGPERAMLGLCAVLVGVYFFRNLFRYLVSYFNTPLRSGLVRNLRSSMMQ